jgi:hypothetical protein
MCISIKNNFQAIAGQEPYLRPASKASIVSGSLLVLYRISPFLIAARDLGPTLY